MQTHNTLPNGTHKIVFSKGKLFLNDKQIAGEGISSEKEIVFTFVINKPSKKIEELTEIEGNPPFLNISVHDSVVTQAVGPGQL